MKKLPGHVQSLLSASNNINNHKKAVEELVYNSIDTGATSVAVRVDIQNNIIQVIDNGCGISKKDFILLGQNYTTSKFVDLSTLKSALDKYGFRGQFLANLINVSKSVKVISRLKNSEDTYIKTFENGREKEVTKCNTRPSKGTTVEVKGFLYNLSIKKKSKDILNELQSIKTFLEHLSLVHSNVSLSLRDDSKNEIIFKMHKNREIYQTLLNLYSIKKEDVHELQVQKNCYKVTAYLSKNDKDVRRDLIFLNGRYIPNTSKLHKIVNNNFNKYLKTESIKRPKRNNVNQNDENHLFRNKVPFYLIFITCPHMDYDLSSSSKQADLEFKDWDHVIKLLEKLVKFYIGDINLKEVTNVRKEKEETNTREQVNQIIHKILGCKKPAISQMQKGIKGKQVKRKVNEKPTIVSLSKVINPKETQHEICTELLNTKNANNVIFNEKISPKIHPKIKNRDYVSKKKTERNISKHKSIKPPRISKSWNSKFKKVAQHDVVPSNIIPQKNELRKEKNKTKKYILSNNDLIQKFAIETDSVKRKCDELEQKTNEILHFRNKRKREVCVTETIHYSNITKNNRNIYMRKNIDEIVIHDYIPKPRKINILNDDHVYNNVKKKAIQSNYDLVQTILKSQQESNTQIIDKANDSVTMMTKKPTACSIYRSINVEPGNLTIPEVTFQSHNYYVNTENNKSHKKKIAT